MQEWGDWATIPFGIPIFFTILIWVGIIGWILDKVRPDKEAEEERKEREHWERLGIDPKDLHSS